MKSCLGIAADAEDAEAGKPMKSPGQSVSTAADRVAELQGLYGAFAFPEKLLQKIWWRGDFNMVDIATCDGRRLTISHRGKWNRLGGPDFRGARFRINAGGEAAGDVEVHLHANDWDAHGHARDPAYAGVALHVVLFPPSPGYVTRGVDGGELPMLALLPLLNHDLEEYAADDAFEALSGRSLAQVAEALAPLPPAELTGLLNWHAESRWWQKVHFAKLRVQRLGWEAACHHAALEILGYRFNRVPMLRIAGVFPLEVWRSIDPIEVFESETSWSLQGIRPANHPRNRLVQYAAWTRERPDWPNRLTAFAGQLPAIRTGVATGVVRHEHRIAGLRAEWSAAVCGKVVSGSRFDNLACDGFLPLLAVRGGGNLKELWHHWYAGDLPRIMLRTLRQLEVFSGRASPACHGVGQGLLGWLLERERLEPQMTAK